MIVQLALARHHGHLGRQQLAAHLGPGQAGADTDPISCFSSRVPIAELRDAEVALQTILRRDPLGGWLRGRTSRPGGRPCGRRWRPRARGSGRRPRLRVLADHLAAAAAVRELDRTLGLQTVGLGDRLGDQEADLAICTFSDLGVARQPDDLHAVLQWTRDLSTACSPCVMNITLRQVVVHVQVVIVERAGSAPGRGPRAAPRTGSPRKSIAHLVDLVEQEHRVATSRPSSSLWMHLAGQRADVGAPVAADLGLVADAAERDAHEVTAGRVGDRLAERRLADARAGPRSTGSVP